MFSSLWRSFLARSCSLSLTDLGGSEVEVACGVGDALGAGGALVFSFSLLGSALEEGETLLNPRNLLVVQAERFSRLSSLFSGSISSSTSSLGDVLC